MTQKIVTVSLDHLMQTMVHPLVLRINRITVPKMGFLSKVRVGLDSTLAQPQEPLRQAMVAIVRNIVLQISSNLVGLDSILVRPQYHLREVMVGYLVLAIVPRVVLQISSDLMGLDSILALLPDTLREVTVD